jgi:hypothetical protein
MMAKMAAIDHFAAKSNLDLDQTTDLFRGTIVCEISEYETRGWGEFIGDA